MDDERSSRTSRMAGYRIGWAQECRPAESLSGAAEPTGARNAAVGELIEARHWAARGRVLAETDAELRSILEESATIAVVGAKALETEDAYRIPLYLQTHGYRIAPVNPKLESVLGHRVVATLIDLDEPIDLVNLFRATDHIPEHVDEILAMESQPKAVWMQLGIHHGPAAARLRAAGIRVVQDRCIMVEHRRLFGVHAA